MTVLFMGGEQESFDTTSGVIVWNTLAGRFDSAFCDGALDVANPAFLKLDIPSTSTAWVHFDGRLEGTGTASGDLGSVVIQSSGTNVLQLNRPAGTSGFNFEYWNGAAWVIIDSSVIIDRALYSYDIRCQLDATNGFFELYQNNILLSSFTGDTTLAASTVDNVGLFGTLAGTNSFSQIISKDTSTLKMKLSTYRIDADGTDTEWTGDFTDIDEAGLVDNVDFIDSNTAEQVSTFTGTFPATPVDFVIEAFALNNWVSAGSVGPQNMQVVTRSGGTVYPSATLPTLNLGLESRRQIITTDPDTGLAWDDTSLAAAEFGVKAKA